MVVSLVGASSSYCFDLRQDVPPRGGATTLFQEAIY